MVLSRRRAASVAVGTPAVVAVMVFGELSTAAFVAVGITGCALAAVGMTRRAGEAAPPVGRSGLPWLGWVAAALSWEVVTLAHDALYTLSDIADPLLAHPPLRGGATVAWLLAGAWLLDRRRHDLTPS